MKKLSIGITHYNEDWSIIKPMLTSIATQRSINFDEIEVIIVNDGEGPYPPDFVFEQPYEVRYVVNEKKTVSAARNRAIRESQGDYIMLCDCDDMFYTCTALYIIFTQMNIDGGFDALVDNFLEETKNPETGEMVYVDHQGNDIFVHSKVWRKQYLIDNDIFFDDELSIHEETPFTILAMNCSENIRLCPVPYYLWCWNDNSVCRRDPKYILKTFKNMIWANISLVERFLRRGMTNQAMGFIASLIYDGYYAMNCKEWKDINNKEYRDSTFEEYKKYYRTYRTLFDKVPEQDQLVISNQIRQRYIFEGKFEMENVLFSDFIIKLNS